MAKAKTPRPDDGGKKKDREKGALGALLSASIGPLLKKWAAQAAVAFPEDHWIRHSEIFKRGFPALTTWLENTSDALPVWAGSLVEQVIDGTDEFSAALNLTTEQGRPSGVVVDDKWIKQILSKVPDRLIKATDKRAELEKIKEELVLLRELNDELTQFAKKQQTPKPMITSTPAQDIEKIKETFKTYILPHAKTAFKEADAVAEKLAPHVGRVADWLEAHGGKTKPAESRLFSRTWQKVCDKWKRRHEK
jgi:hypothetical protein